MSFPVVDSLILWMIESEVPFRVTSTWRPADGKSLHSLGVAVDFAGPRPGRGTPDLLAIYEALEPLGPACRELIYSTNGWKNGRRFVYNATTERQHENHVHIAMPDGWTWQPPPKEVKLWKLLRIPSALPWSGLFRRLQGRATG